MADQRRCPLGSRERLLLELAFRMPFGYWLELMHEVRWMLPPWPWHLQTPAVIGRLQGVSLHSTLDALCSCERTQTAGAAQHNRCPGVQGNQAAPNRERQQLAAGLWLGRLTAAQPSLCPSAALADGREAGLTSPYDKGESQVAAETASFKVSRHVGQSRSRASAPRATE
jgi:hypothetical protein